MGRILPVGGGNVTSPYLGGYRYQGGHSGTDFGAAHGAPIVAAAYGTVVFSGWDGAYGYHTKIRHPDGTETWYAHQSQMLVSRGDQVAAGQIIGKVGSTGNSTAPHLHFEVRIDGRMTDPMTWLKGAQTPSPDHLVTSDDPYAWASSSPASYTRTGVRITPVLPEEYIVDGRADFAAIEQRFGTVAAESRFGLVAEESREGVESTGSDMEMPDMPDAEIIWDSLTTGRPEDDGSPMALENARSGGSYTGGDTDAIIKQAYDLMRQVGAPASVARVLAALVIPESSGNPRALNDNPYTRDKSYGLWQINMLGGMGPQRRREFGLASNEQLYDPLTNARVAYQIYRNQGYGAWGAYNSPRPGNEYWRYLR